MEFYTFILVKIIVVAISRGIEISLELQKNILKFGYGINYKYEGMLTHLFDKFYIVTKFMLPSMGDIKFSNLNFDLPLYLSLKGIITELGKSISLSFNVILMFDQSISKTSQIQFFLSFTFSGFNLPLILNR